MTLKELFEKVDLEDIWNELDGKYNTDKESRLSTDYFRIWRDFTSEFGKKYRLDASGVFSQSEPE